MTIAKWRISFNIGITAVAIVAGAALPTQLGRTPDNKIDFKKTVIDSRFVAEGVAVGDVNRDGRPDILAGNVWYEAPKDKGSRWAPHEIAPVLALDPKSEYSDCFNTWAADLNRDGWVDQILIGKPGEKATWRENPKAAEGLWKVHPIWRSAGNESPLYEDLFGNRKKVLMMAYDDARLAWFEPAADPNAEWICHDVSQLKGAGSQRYSHGLGVGDLDGDGRNEIVTTTGYYVAPKNPRKELWTFVKADLGPDCAQMVVWNHGKGVRASVLTTSAHARGVWHFVSTELGNYKRYVIDERVSGTHAANLAVLGKSKALNLITGKRKWAHPPGVDVGSEEQSVLIRYELSDASEFQVWRPHVIDEDSGVGTQFVVQDMNRDGQVDIVIANKNGVFLFLQSSKPSPK